MSLRNPLFSSLVLVSTLAACGRAPANGSETLDTAETPTAIRATDGLPAWHTAMLARASATTARNDYTECVQVAEIRGAYLCGSARLPHMNQAMTRATLYVEGGFGNPKGTVASPTSSAYQQGVSMFGGHDLRSQDLMAFWRDAQAACTRDQSLCSPAPEKEFFESFVLPKAANNEEFVVITYAVEGGRWEDVVTHEIMHAQYFLQPAFRTTADAFWRDQVSEADKADVKQTLAPYYNVEDELLLKNEFQAYMLMAGAEFSVLGVHVGTYRTGLMQAITAAGVTPIQVH